MILLLSPFVWYRIFKKLGRVLLDPLFEVAVWNVTIHVAQAQEYAGFKMAYQSESSKGKFAVMYGEKSETGKRFIYEFRSMRDPYSHLPQIVCCKHVLENLDADTEAKLKRFERHLITKMSKRFHTPDFLCQGVLPKGESVFRPIR